MAIELKLEDWPKFTDYKTMVGRPFALSQQCERENGVLRYKLVFVSKWIGHVNEYSISFERDADAVAFKLKYS